MTEGIRLCSNVEHVLYVTVGGEMTMSLVYS